MGSLFKFIFYLIIIIFWVLNNTKKQEKWKKDSSAEPEQPSEHFKKPVPEPASLPPAMEGIFDEKTQADVVSEVSMMPYDQVLQIRRKKTNRQIREKPAPAAASLPDEETADEEPILSVPLLKEKIKKPALILKSSIKEGIIWSIILGPPRSRERFNWKGSPFQR
ncbi:MAG: hypothetical protein L6416_02890 [Candidatus Omnitrophica bacterium]|nr:hypothetical protein [Candidatus Omnitrophota bacterium]